MLWVISTVTIIKSVYEGMIKWWEGDRDICGVDFWSLGEGELVLVERKEVKWSSGVFFCFFFCLSFLSLLLFTFGVDAFTVI